MIHICGLIAALLLASWSHAETEVVVFVDDGYEPYSFSEQGKAKGMYIDVLSEAFSRMDGFTVKLKPIPWQRGKRLMEQGKGFALAPAFFHGHDWPYLYPAPFLSIRKQSLPSVKRKFL